MRILSIVTLVSPLGEYGGPLRVAVNQARALQSLGHSVTLAGAARGYADALPTSVEGIPALLHPARTLLPRTGFAGLGAPGLWRRLRAEVESYDVVHVHLARDLVTLPAARIAGSHGVRYVVQTHGMIDPSSHPLARPLDAALTKRVLRGAAHVLYLTSPEREALQEVAGELDLMRLINGVPETDLRASAPAPTVLFLARLAPRKRPVLFVEAAHRVGRDHPDARFVVVGPDEGEGPAVRAAVARARTDGIDITNTDRWNQDFPGLLDEAEPAAYEHDDGNGSRSQAQDSRPRSVLGLAHHRSAGRSRSGWRRICRGRHHRRRCLHRR